MLGATPHPARKDASHLLPQGEKERRALATPMPHPEERALARVSKDGLQHQLPMVLPAMRSIIRRRRQRASSP